METIQTKGHLDEAIGALCILVVGEKCNTCDYEKNCRNG